MSFVGDGLNTPFVRPSSTTKLDSCGFTLELREDDCFRCISGVDTDRDGFVGLAVVDAPDVVDVAGSPDIV